ncbi:AAA domain-containing protein [Russula earlei]|uniref:AAA domain-containing protein n=1 Tax=Russula earlei TaxID=71964 RepID=A0ACC0TVJ1_9AGAM|nr:AAA domain-containing protein [Russula earlei]
MVSTSIFIYLYLSHGLYADASVNLYYTIMSIIGWIMWTRKKEDNQVLQISLMLYIVLKAFTDSTVPYADSFTSAAAFTGMWLMNKKKVANWFWWVITNIASIPLNYYKGLAFTSFHYKRISTMDKNIFKIAVIGPESTGKSTLCEQLANHYNTIWCPEFAREYLLTHGKTYNFNDLDTIARGQLALEDEYTRSVIARNATISCSPLLFIDTEMYVMKVWCEYVFGKCHPFILEEIINRKYDLYLFCNIDLPWTQDELREYPDEQPRRELYQIYKDILINQQTPWVDISGNYEERLEKGIAAIEANLILPQRH